MATGISPPGVTRARTGGAIGALLFTVAVLQCVVSDRSSAATVNVPTLTVTQLTRSVSSPVRPDDPFFVFDAITMPGSGYVCSGFDATISPGDTVVIRFQAPTGKKFVMHAPGGLLGQYFFVNTQWTASDGVQNSEDQHAITFENFQGRTPDEYYSHVSVGNGGWIGVWKIYVVGGPFEFTAIVIKIIASPRCIPVARNYGDVQVPGWGASAQTWRPLDDPLLEIVDIGAVETRRESWGRLKLRYR